MSNSSPETSPTSSGDTTEETAAEPELLQAQLDLLEEENRRLREEYVRAKRSAYQRTAVGLAVLGVLGVLAAVLFPIVRDVLLVLGAIGLFGGILTYYLTPEKFVAAETGDQIVAATDRTLQSIAAQLDLADARLYVPTPSTDPARLFVPQHERSPDQRFSVPDGEELTQPFVTVGELDRGLSVVPAGGTLYREFERTAPEHALDASLATQIDVLAEALVEQFELADAIDTEVSSEDGRATIRITDAAYGDADRFEDPLASFLAVGCAQILDRPVQMEQQPQEDDLLVTLRWNLEEKPT